MSLSSEAGRLFDAIKGQKQDYQLACNQPAMQRMLIDLAWYCKANDTCVVEDKNGKVDVEATLIMEGRRQVWTRMMNHCNLSTQQLYALATGKQFNPGDEHG